MSISEKMRYAREIIASIPLRYNDVQKFYYAASIDIKQAVKAAMDSAQILFVPEVLAMKSELTPTAKSVLVAVTVDMVLHFIDTSIPVGQDDREIAVKWPGYGFDYGSEKALGKAITYGLKSYWLHSFLIPTEEDDPDSGKCNNDQPPVMPHPDNQRNRNAQKMTSLSTQAELDKRRAWYGVTPSPWSPPPGFIGETESDWMQASIRHIDSLLSSKKIDQQAADVLAVEIEKLAKQAKPGPLTYQYLVYLQHLALDKFEPALPEQFVRIRNMAPLVPDAEARTICREKLGADHPRVLSKTDCETLIEEVAKLAATRGK